MRACHKAKTKILLHNISRSILPISIFFREIDFTINLSGVFIRGVIPCLHSDFVGEGIEKERETFSYVLIDFTIMYMFGL